MAAASRSRIVAEVDFDKNGRQQGFLRLFHSVHSSAYGFIPIPIEVVKNGKGPTAVFTSGNHGDEYEGQVAICNLARKLDPAHFSHPQIYLAEIFLRRGNKRAAADVLEDFLRHHPDDPRAELMRKRIGEMRQ